VARRPRDDAPGALHHVMVRGIDRSALFLDDIDREDFLRRLSQLIPELGFRCFAWALMSNHVHFVIRSGPARVSRLMARLGTGYVGRFNRRHDRVGHLFQNRFRSRRAYDDADLMGLVLYVIRNPLEAGLVANPLDLERFPWCGLGALMGRCAARPFEGVSETLELFDASPERARERIRTRLGALAPPHPDVAPCVAPRPIEPRRNAPSFEVLLREVCGRFGVAAAELRSRARTERVVRARAELAARASAVLGLSGAEIARRLGVTRAAVSLMIGRARGGPDSELTT
jgi:REP element-mobilizing transposase RayT